MDDHSGQCPRVLLARRRHGPPDRSWPHLAGRRGGQPQSVDPCPPRTESSLSQLLWFCLTASVIGSPPGGIHPIPTGSAVPVQLLWPGLASIGLLMSWFSRAATSTWRIVRKTWRPDVRPAPGDASYESTERSRRRQEESHPRPPPDQIPEYITVQRQTNELPRPARGPAALRSKSSESTVHSAVA